MKLGKRTGAALAAPVAAVTLAACGSNVAEAPDPAPAPTPDPTPASPEAKPRRTGDDPSAAKLRRELARERKANRDMLNRFRHMLRRERRVSIGVRFTRLAASQIGTPYVWGGQNPGGFDCSGLLQWSARKLGRSIPRTTYGLISYGRAVSTRMSAWKIGDLVFPSTGHVGVYAGNGKVVESPRSGLTVRLAPARPAVAVRRVFA